MAETSPPIPALFSQGDFGPNSLVKGESMFLLLEFERADNDRSNATGPLRIQSQGDTISLLVFEDPYLC